MDKNSLTNQDLDGLLCLFFLPRFVRFCWYKESEEKKEEDKIWREKSNGIIFGKWSKTKLWGQSYKTLHPTGDMNQCS